MQEVKNISTKTTLIVIAIAVAVVLAIYAFSSGGTETPSQTTAPVASSPSEEIRVENTTQENDTVAEVSPEPTPPTGDANPTVITNTLSELEQGFDEMYDDSTVDSSFEDQTSELTQTYDL